jgi:hypothetical protein
MANITRSSAASMDASSGMFAPQKTGSLYAGEALDPVAPCYIKASDGLVYMSNGTADNEAAKFDGFTAKAYRVGDAVTLFGIGARFRYGTSLAIGNLYISATAGRLDTAPTVGCKVPIARTMNSTDIIVTANAERVKSWFVSTEQTGTGAAQNVAHGLGAAPTKVFVAPTELAADLAAGYDVAEGAHDATNVVLTVTTGAKFKVLAFL